MVLLIDNIIYSSLGILNKFYSTTRRHMSTTHVLQKSWTPSHEQNTKTSEK